MTRIPGTTFSDSNAPTYVYVVCHLTENLRSIPIGTKVIFHKVYRHREDAERAVRNDSRLGWEAVELV